MINRSDLWTGRCHVLGKYESFRSTDPKDSFALIRCSIWQSHPAATLSTSAQSLNLL